jgi:uncharacterized membrane-anchored protein YhcB (DUF1043 family)
MKFIVLTLQMLCVIVGICVGKLIIKFIDNKKG